MDCVQPIDEEAPGLCYASPWQWLKLLILFLQLVTHNLKSRWTSAYLAGSASYISFPDKLNNFSEHTNMDFGNAGQF